MVEKVGPDGKLMTEMILVWCVCCLATVGIQACLIDSLHQHACAMKLRCISYTFCTLQNSLKTSFSHIQRQASLTSVVCCSNNLRNDLSHPNEYIRGSTFRFLCKLKEPELLEPLIPVIKQNLEHRMSFVRRNAVLSMFAIYKNFKYLLPDAPDLIYAFLNQVNE